MKIAIYQININRDGYRVAFSPYDKTMQILRDYDWGCLDAYPYDKVWYEDNDLENLEDVYYKFNNNCPAGYRGHSLSISDVIEVIEGAEVKPGFYFVDSIGFKKIDFDVDLTRSLRLEKIKVVYCQPGKFAEIIEIGTETGDLHAAVGGYFETYYPFSDGVCIVCNDEGKLDGSAPCRAVYSYDENGEAVEIIDIIFGNFFICGDNVGEFQSLSEEQLKYYKEKFYYPEEYYRIGGKIYAQQVLPEDE